MQAPNLQFYKNLGLQGYSANQKEIFESYLLEKQNFPGCRDDQLDRAFAVLSDSRLKHVYDLEGEAGLRAEWCELRLKAIVSVLQYNWENRVKSGRFEFARLTFYKSDVKEDARASSPDDIRPLLLPDKPYTLEPKMQIVRENPHPEQQISRILNRVRSSEQLSNFISEHDRPTDILHEIIHVETRSLKRDSPEENLHINCDNEILKQGSPEETSKDLQNSDSKKLKKRSSEESCKDLQNCDSKKLKQGRPEEGIKDLLNSDSKIMKRKSSEESFKDLQNSDNKIMNQVDLNPNKINRALLTPEKSLVSWPKSFPSTAWKLNL